MIDMKSVFWSSSEGVGSIPTSDINLETAFASAAIFDFSKLWLQKYCKGRLLGFFTIITLAVDQIPIRLKKVSR